MDSLLYLMLMENQKQLDAGVIERHVDHLKAMDAAGALVLCGPFAEGGGMVVFRAESFEAAEKTAQSDPYIFEGYKTFRLKTLQVAEKQNGYLLS